MLTSEDIAELKRACIGTPSGAQEVCGDITIEKMVRHIIHLEDTNKELIRSIHRMVQGATTNEQIIAPTVEMIAAGANVLLRDVTARASAVPDTEHFELTSAIGYAMLNVDHQPERARGGVYVKMEDLNAFLSVTPWGNPQHSVLTGYLEQALPKPVTPKLPDGFAYVECDACRGLVKYGMEDCDKCDGTGEVLAKGAE